MKIVYVYDAIARIGGVERILVDKMNYLSDHYHHDVYLITAAQGNHGYSFPLSPNVKHIDINVRFHLQYQYKYPKRLWVKWKMDYLLKKELQKQVKAIDPDIIIGTTYYKADVICKLKCRAKKIIESHCAKSYTGVADGVNRNAVIRLFHRLYLIQYNNIIERQSDALIVLTRSDASEWNKQKNVFIIPNTINCIPQETSSYKKKRVISVGRLVYQKGFDRLISAWKTVHNRHPDWQLDIFGEGAHKEILLKQIKNEKLESTIRINPYAKQIFQEYINSSIFVLPSRYEGFGLVLIEAMACGLPCVSFDCPYGPSDIIKEQEDGILVPNDDINKLGDKICYLIENEQTMTKFGNNARENSKRFLPEHIMLLWDQLLKRITQ